MLPLSSWLWTLSILLFVNRGQNQHLNFIRIWCMMYAQSYQKWSISVKFHVDSLMQIKNVRWYFYLVQKTRSIVFSEMFVANDWFDKTNHKNVLMYGSKLNQISEILCACDLQLCAVNLKAYQLYFLPPLTLKFWRFSHLFSVVLMENSVFHSAENDFQKHNESLECMFSSNVVWQMSSLVWINSWKEW